MPAVPTRWRCGSAAAGRAGPGSGSSAGRRGRSGRRGAGSCVLLVAGTEGPGAVSDRCAPATALVLCSGWEMCCNGGALGDVNAEKWNLENLKTCG